MNIYKEVYIQYKKKYSYYLKKVVFIINKIHKTSYDENYWEPIIGIYLRRFIINFLFLKKKKEILFNKPTIKNSKFFLDYQEFSEHFNNVDHKKIKYFKLKNNIQVKKINSFFLIKLNLKDKIYYSFLNLLIKLKLCDTLISIHFEKKLDKIKFILKTKFKFLIFKDPSVRIKDYNKKFVFYNRLKIIKLCNNFYSDNLLNNLFFFMPINYLEIYNFNKKYIDNLICVDKFYSDGNEISSDYIKFYLGKLNLEKKKIFFGQHSIRSGYEDFGINFDYLNKLAYKYLTWGEKRDHKVFKNSGSTRLFISLKKFNININKVTMKTNNNICFFLSDFSFLGSSLEDNYIENIKAENYRVKFLEKLQKSSKKIFLKFKSNNQTFIKQSPKTFQKYKKINDFKLSNIFRNFDIIIFERLSVGIVECIYLNQPVIFHFPKNIYEYQNKKYRKMINLLKLSKVYINDSSEILRIISSEKNYKEWWNNKNNIKFRQIFLKKYAKVLDFNSLSKYII